MLSLAAAFRYALVGKFSHGAPQYRNLHRLITELGIKGAFTVSMINAKHVLISLSNEVDFSRLWLRQIWYIQGFPMRVFKWTPTFTPAQESSIVPVWSKLSKARVGIEIDLTAPIVEDFDLQINGRTIRQKVVYEQVPKYCNLCKHVGHDNLECFSMGNAPRPPPRNHTVKQPKGKEKKMTDERVAMEKGECSKTVEDCPRYAPEETLNEVPENEKNDNACVEVVRNIEENNDIVHVDEIDDAYVGVSDETLEEGNAVVVSDANFRAEALGKNELIVKNTTLCVGTYFIRNTFERWEKRPKRMKLKQAVQLLQNLKSLGHVCPGIRHCKDIDETGLTITKAFAKAQAQIFWNFSDFSGSSSNGRAFGAWAVLEWARAPGQSGTAQELGYCRGSWTDRFGLALGWIVMGWIGMGQRAWAEAHAGLDRVLGCTWVEPSAPLGCCWWTGTEMS
ncbi:UNVERIFIED_CONTAM: hypothetical protein Slati_3570300 [Sesamum latifolium]|uniref:DUF4283 domain-containing protein n=1 Tax=Sesamum latifolium TaxID=2727402 RepID=A0AAW2UJ93_9LAMI